MRDSKGDTDVKNRLLDSVEEGEGGMIWKNSNETCILPYVKQIASPSSMHETVLRAGTQGWPWGMGWGGRWEGFQDEEHMYSRVWFMSMYSKNHHHTAISLQLK